MGTIAARKARTILENAQRVLAIELLAACQAVDLARPRADGPRRTAPRPSSRPPTARAPTARCAAAVPFMAEDQGACIPTSRPARALVADGAILATASRMPTCHAKGVTMTNGDTRRP